MIQMTDGYFVKLYGKYWVWFKFDAVRSEYCGMFFNNLN
jgi:hypothetical protein